MTIIKNLTKSFLAFVFLFFASAVFATSAQAAPKIYFDPANYTTGKNTDFSVNLKIDVESQSAVGADAVLTFPSNDLTLKSVQNGGFFTDFSYSESGGRIEIHAFFASANESKTGSGNIAVLTFTPLKDSGNGAVNIVCSDSGIYDTNVNNILSCSSTNQLSLTYAAQSSPGSSTPGPTNACGGTCGSNNNCNANLFCYQGFCRNPDCRDDVSCGCRATTRPSPTIRSTPRATASATPEVIALTKYTPNPSATASSTPSTTPQGKKFDWKNIGVVGLVAVAVAFLVWLANKLFGKKKDTHGPPQIENTPPPPPVPPTGF